jgi:hypothetical protein
MSCEALTPRRAHFGHTFSSEGAAGFATTCASCAPSASLLIQSAYTLKSITNECPSCFARKRWRSAVGEPVRCVGVTPRIRTFPTTQLSRDVRRIEASIQVIRTLIGPALLIHEQPRLREA